MRTPIRRRRFLAAAGAAGLAGCGEPSDPTADPDGGADPTDGDADSPATSPSSPEEPTAAPTDERPDAVGLDPLVTGLDAPVDVAFAPDADRRYLVQQAGLVRVHEGDVLLDEPFLDLRESVESGGERGLLGLALHPRFPDDPRAFVRYSAPRREGTPSDYSHTFVLASFEVGGDGRRADPDSERTVLTIPQPQGNHNAGDLAFGPEGLLYVAVGDGGAGGDRGLGHADDWYDAVEGGNGQDVAENLLGSLLRIDADGDGGNDQNGTGTDDREYAIPDDNPLVGSEGLDEHYAWGLRNPWRMTFDGEDLFVADVGQDRHEEVNLVEEGGNYGWNVKEGAHCFGADECPDATPEDVRGGEPLLDPIVEYPHSGAEVSGISVIGGHVYRGSALPELEGAYVFGDLQPEGRLFVARRPDGGDDGHWPTRAVEVTGGLERVLSFGRDRDGEVYVLGTGPDGEGLYRIVPA